MKKVIAIASDHAGVELKQILKQELSGSGYAVTDLGTDSKDSVDYPDYANKMADWIKSHPKDKGVLLCGSGIGVSMAANRHKHVRAALICSEQAAQLARQHNDANVACFGVRLTDAGTIKSSLAAFLNTEFEGGRHQRRVDKLST